MKNFEEFWRMFKISWKFLKIEWYNVWNSILEAKINSAIIHDLVKRNEMFMYLKSADVSIIKFSNLTFPWGYFKTECNS